MLKAGAKSHGYGFLGIVVDEDGGYSGGFLVLNSNGRPLEFHCTMTIKPSRAQEILYGPTLRPYLAGEQIGGTLVGKARTKLKAVFTNDPHCSSLRDAVDIPLFLIEGSHESESQSDEALSANHDGVWRQFNAEGLTLRTCDEAGKDRSRFENEFESDLRHVDLVEPFARVHEAIGETLNPGRAA